MKNKEKVKDKVKKVKRISGMPMSAFVAYSRKRRNMENALKSRKSKKKRALLSEILAGNKSVELTESDTSLIVNSPAKDSSPKNSPDSPKKNSPDSPKKNSPDSPKKKRKKELKKSYKCALMNGHSGSPKAAKENKRLIKAKTSPKKQAIIQESSDSSSIECLSEEAEIPQTQKTSPEPTAERTQVQSIKKTDESSVDDEVSVVSSNAVTSNGSTMDRSPQKYLDDTIPKSLSNNPMKEGRALFEWLINPLSVNDFFKSNWEKAPLHIKRSKSNYYKLLMSTPLLDKILRDSYVLYTKNIDITSYSNGQRETHNPSGRARPSVVWDYYSNGCSVRMLNPQTFIPRLHALNATLQEFFGCFVGANSYLTPPDSQGFAPHYDDIEAFILQIEGKKRWRLYKPTSESEYLPRYSSKNFDPSEIGEPMLDTVVNAGDLLYFPRGTIHQGETIDGTHSLHVTLSVYQKNSWCDFLEKLIPEALNSAVQTDSSYREGLPIDYLRHVGLVHSTKDSDVRQKFVDKTKDLLHRLIDHIDVDKVADQMAKINVHDFLPPVVSPQEQERSIIRDGERMTTAGVIENRVEIEPDTKIRLLRSHCIRLVEEEDTMRIYYSTENSKEYHEYEPQFLEVERHLAPAIEEIVRCYPDFVRVDDLPIEGEDNRVQVARDLWEKCIVVTDVPLPVVE